jgi:hypothetical protein
LYGALNLAYASDFLYSPKLHIVLGPLVSLPELLYPHVSQLYQAAEYGGRTAQGWSEKLHHWTYRNMDNAKQGTFN